MTKSVTILQKFYAAFHKHGLTKICVLLLNYSLNYTRNFFRQLFYFYSFNSIVNRRRVHLGIEIAKKTNWIVLYGPLKSFRISSNSVWGKADVGAMLLGLYEREVQDILYKESMNRSYFCELGAADGFYGVGVVAAKLYQKSYCYETQRDARDRLRKIAMINQVSSSIKVLSTADTNFYSYLQQDGVPFCQLVILSDVEGGEYRIFSNETLKALSQAVLIIEIHDWDGRSNDYLLLLERASCYFVVSEHRTGSRNLNGITELNGYADSDRWIICSEGRGDFGKFLYLRPKPEHILNHTL